MRFLNCTLSVAVLSFAATSSAQPPPRQQQQQQQPAQRAQQQAIDPQAIQALERMSMFLRQQKSFSVKTNTETDYVLEDGEAVTLTAHGELYVERPNRIRANVFSERKPRQFFYDGKNFTIYSPRVGYFSTVKAPPTIIELADTLHDTYGLELPLVDLFRWGSTEASFDEIESARYIGVAKIDGIDTDHYAFRQEGLDWQIWIQRGPQPLPRKIVMTTTDDPAHPQHAVELAWTLDAKHDPRMFAFAPPRDAKQIRIAKLLPQQDQQARRVKRSPRG
jgi:hypothetical protein